MWIYTKSWVNGAMDNGSNCLLVQKVAGTEQIGLSHSRFAWLMVQEILDNGSILFLFSTSTGTGLWIGTKVAFQTLHCYCVCCELLSASIADALLFVNIIVSGIFHGRFAQRLAVNKPCLQIVRHLLWKQTTTHSIRNNNAMFEQQPLSQFKGPSQYI